jgi:hypothetical protein
MSKKIFFMLSIISLHFAADAQLNNANNALVNVQRLGSDRSAAKAAREFWKRYGDGKNETWYKLPEAFLAEFTEGAVKCRSVFDHAGNWLYTIREYTEKELPKEVRHLVKSTYYDYSIGWVKEVTQYQSVVYVVHIKNAPAWKDVLVQDGEMEVQHEGEN